MTVIMICTVITLMATLIVVGNIYCTVDKICNENEEFEEYMANISKQSYDIK